LSCADGIFSTLQCEKQKQKAQKKNHPSLLAPLSGNFALLNGGAISQKNQMGLHLTRLSQISLVLDFFRERRWRFAGDFA
jgi:hypothetical protein